MDSLTRSPAYADNRHCPVLYPVLSLLAAQKSPSLHLTSPSTDPELPTLRNFDPASDSLKAPF